MLPARVLRGVEVVADVDGDTVERVPDRVLLPAAKPVIDQVDLAVDAAPGMAGIAGGEGHFGAAVRSCLCARRAVERPFWDADARGVLPRRVRSDADPGHWATRLQAHGGVGHRLPVPAGMDGEPARSPGIDAVHEGFGP